MYTMLEDLLRGHPGKNGKHGKDGRHGRDGVNAYPPHEMEYIRINAASQTCAHDARITLPRSTNEFFTVSGNVITFNKTGDYNIHYHTLGRHVDYAWDKVVVHMIRNNDGYVLEDGYSRRVQNMNYAKVHFSKDEAIYFKCMYTPTTLDAIVGTINIDIKKI